MKFTFSSLPSSKVETKNFEISKINNIFEWMNRYGEYLMVFASPKRGHLIIQYAMTAKMLRWNYRMYSRFVRPYPWPLLTYFEFYPEGPSAMRSYLCTAPCCAAPTEFQTNSSNFAYVNRFSNTPPTKCRRHLWTAPNMFGPDIKLRSV